MMIKQSEVTPMFEIGKEYPALNNTSFKITILKRTPKTVYFTLKVDGEESPFGVSTKRVKIVKGSEYFIDGIQQYYANIS